jgi:hypothetical protein
LYLFRLTPIGLGSVRFRQGLFILLALQTDVFGPFRFGQEEILAIEDSDKTCSSSRLLAPSFFRDINYDLVVGRLSHTFCFEFASDFKFLMESGQRCRVVLNSLQRLPGDVSPLALQLVRSAPSKSTGSPESRLIFESLNLSGSLLNRSNSELLVPMESGIL